MAVYPGMIQQRGVRSTTIVTQGNPSAGIPGSITSRELTSSSQSRVTPEDVSDPARLTKVLSDMQEWTDAATRASRSNPFSAPCIVRGVTFAPGQTVVVPHTLGRPFTDWHTARAQGTAPSLVEVPLPSAAHPGVTPDKAVVLQHVGASAGVFTVVVVGD